MPRGKIRFSDIYKWSGVWGMNVGAMSLFEFVWAQRGYAEANGQKPKGGTIDDGRLSELGIAGFD